MDLSGNLTVQLLSTEELLLVNTLLYFQDKTSFCLQEIDKEYLYNAIQKNKTLMSLRFITATRFSEENALCAAFMNEESSGSFKELIVVFRGTSKGEWLDNFLGAAATDAADGVSTRQQQKALNWYQTLPKDDCFVTVTGHSKGGNKAKYISVLEDSVDRCVSFNGQGFSEEFMLWYYARIALRQSIVENHNTQYDYVNWLLHDFGSMHFYKNQMTDKGVLAGHCANAMLTIDISGVCSMEYVGQEQPKLIRKLDWMLNFLLHILPKRQKIDLLEWIGIRMEYAMIDIVIVSEIFKEISRIFQTILA